MTVQPIKNLNIFVHTVHLSTLKLSAGNPISDIELFQSQLNEYPERALLLADSDDYIILNHYPDKQYLDYLMDIGIGTGNILIPTTQGESLSDSILKDITFLKKLIEATNKLVLHPYISTQAEAEIASTINASVNGSPPDLTTKVNSKCYLPSLLHELALPMPAYEIATSVTVVETARQLIDKYEKIVILGNQTYGGLAVWPITQEEELNAFELEVSKCNQNEQFLVEKKYDVLCSPNIQYQIDLDSIQELGVADQILDDKLKYHGNTYPLSTTQLDKIRLDSYRIGENLQSQGYRGLLGIDLIETTGGEVFVVDINGRANASTFGLNVIRKLFPDFSPHVKILTHLNVGKKVTFTELTEILGRENLFNRQTGQGILPYNTGFLQWGKFSAIVIADTQQEANRLYHLL
ncbi:MAG: hypothetical protein DRR19_02905 [Candidatus Parabeggiatoa sp. nov. 1]|nr:MAG: hypothetical protein DRR19_02905 [Gammaproteobacteria bacterium]